MNKPKIHIILGSIREGRIGEKVATWFMHAVKDITTAELTLIDLKNFPLPFFADHITPSMRVGRHDNPQVQKWLDTINEADGYIIVTPEYNHSVPGTLKNAMDWPNKEWNNKPVGFVAYGGLAGGSRAIEHLRQIIAEVQMFDIKEQVLIPMPHKAFDETGALLHGDGPTKTAQLMIEKIAKLAGLLLPMRQPTG